MRKKHEMIEGRPISVWDAGDEVIDRYTVVYLDEVDERGMVQYLAMDAKPFHPQGYGQHGEMALYYVASKRGGGVLNKRIKFADLPIDCQQAVINDLTKY